MNRDEIHALTDDALRRAIAERLGWRDVADIEYWAEDYDDTYLVHNLDGVPPVSSNRWIVPDWPGDPGAALRACMDVARVRDDYLLIEPNSNDTWGASMGPLSMEGVRTSFEVLRSPLARALAELLLLALDGDV